MSAPAVAFSAERLAALLPGSSGDEADLLCLFQLLYDRRYTGPIVLHFKNGRALVAELPAPRIHLGAS